MAEPAKHAVPANDAALEDQSGLFDRGLLYSSYPPPVVEARKMPRATTERSPFRVVVASDLSDMSEAVFIEGIRFARARPPAELHVLTVVRKSGDKYRIPFDRSKTLLTPEQVQEKMEASMRTALQQRRPQIEGLFDKVSVHVAAGDPATEILRLSDDILADLIVLGARDYQGWQRRVWGSVYKTVVARASISVVICRPADFSHGARVPMVAPPRFGTAAPVLRHTVPIYDRRAHSSEKQTTEEKKTEGET